MLNPIDLIPPPWGLVVKVVAPVLIAASLYGAGYYKGYQHEKTITVTKTVEHVTTQYRDILVQQPKEAAQIKKNEDKYNDAILQVPQVVLLNPTCDLGPGALGVLNSVRGSLPTQP